MAQRVRWQAFNGLSWTEQLLPSRSSSIYVNTFLSFIHNDNRAFDNSFQKYILGFRLIIVSHWCPSLPDFAGFGMHFNFTDVPYHYYDKANSFKHVHSATNEVCGILRLQKCGYIGSDLTRNISDFERFCT